MAGYTVWSHMTSDLSSTLEVCIDEMRLQIDVYFTLLYNKILEYNKSQSLKGAPGPQKQNLQKNCNRLPTWQVSFLLPTHG